MSQERFDGAVRGRVNLVVRGREGNVEESKGVDRDVEGFAVDGRVVDERTGNGDDIEFEEEEEGGKRFIRQQSFSRGSRGVAGKAG